MAAPSYDPLGSMVAGAQTGLAIGQAMAQNAYRMQQLKSQEAVRQMQERHLAQQMQYATEAHDLAIQERADMTKAMAKVQMESHPFLTEQAPVSGPPTSGDGNLGNAQVKVPNPAYQPLYHSLMQNILPVIAKYRPQEADNFISSAVRVAKEAEGMDNTGPGAIQTIQAPDGGKFNVYVPPKGRGSTQLVGESTPETKQEGGRTFIRDKSGNWKPLAQDAMARMTAHALNKQAEGAPDLSIPNPEAPGLRMIDPNRFDQFSLRQGNTTANKTKLAASITQAQKTISSLQELQNTLRPEDVGVKGVIGNEILDVWLPQLGLDSADVQRMDNRTKLKALTEGMLRQVSDDTRFSNADREDIKKILPSAGMRESYPNAMRTALTLEQIFAKRALIDSQTLGRKSPPWAISALTREKVLESAKAGIIDEEGLLDAIRLQKISPDEAIQFQSGTAASTPPTR